MRICRRCGGEFVDGIEVCPTCELPLVGAGAASEAEDGEGAEDEEAAVLSEGPLPHIKELKTFLGERGIPSAIVGCEEQGGGCGAARMRLAVPVPFADEAYKLLEERWREQVEREGTGAAAEAGPVDLDADSVTCPACGHQGPLKNGACAECELALT